MHFGVSDHQHIGAVGRKKGWRRYKEPLEILNELYWTWMKEYPYHYSDKFPTVLQQERLPEVCLWWGSWLTQHFIYVEDCVGGLGCFKIFSIVQNLTEQLRAKGLTTLCPVLKACIHHPHIVLKMTQLHHAD